MFSLWKILRYCLIYSCEKWNYILSQRNVNKVEAISGNYVLQKRILDSWSPIRALFWGPFGARQLSAWGKPVLEDAFSSSTSSSSVVYSLKDGQ
jgi:hypothetical protein